MGYVKQHIRNGRRVRGYHRSNPRAKANVGAVLFAIIVVLIVLYAVGHA